MERPKDETKAIADIFKQMDEIQERLEPRPRMTIRSRHKKRKDKTHYVKGKFVEGLKNRLDEQGADVKVSVHTVNKDCVLKAVNPGDDTDTTGAVAGGLAGLCYGYDGIPAGIRGYNHQRVRLFSSARIVLGEGFAPAHVCVIIPR